MCQIMRMISLSRWDLHMHLNVVVFRLYMTWSVTRAGCCLELFVDCKTVSPVDLCLNFSNHMCLSNGKGNRFSGPIINTFLSTLNKNETSL